MSDPDDWEDPEPDPGRGQGYGGGQLQILLPSGATLTVMTVGERDYLHERIGLYHDHNQFTNISDLQDLDRLMGMELMVYRWQNWQGTGTDYNGEPFDERYLNAQMKDYSTELRQLKKLLGLDRPARERAKGEGSVPHFWANLLERAKAFGVMRERQLDRALELTNELIGMVQLHDNATPKEREEMHVQTEDVIAWIREVYTPEYQSIDAHFRANEQRFWVRTQ